MQTIVHLHQHSEDLAQVLQGFVQHAGIGVQETHCEPLQNEVKVTHGLISQSVQALKCQNQGSQFTLIAVGKRMKRAGVKI